MARDTQRQKLYNAESSIHEPPKLTMDDCEHFIRKVIDSPWFEKAYIDGKIGRGLKPGQHIQLKDGRGTRNAFANDTWGQSPIINLPLWARQHPIVLHELAHLTSRSQPAHGWMFARDLLALVRRFMSADDARKLETAFKSHRVKFKAPTKRQAVFAAVRKHKGEPVNVTFIDKDGMTVVLTDAYLAAQFGNPSELTARQGNIQRVLRIADIEKVEHARQ